MEKTNNAKPFTIQINSLEALERLIGGSSEMELALRNAVVQAFAEKHLKAVFNDSKFQEKLNTVITMVEKQSQDVISKAFGKWKESGGYYNTKTFVLSDEIKKQVEDEAWKRANTIINDATNSAIEKWITKDYIGKTVERYINNEFETTVKSAVNERLKQIAQNINK